MIAAKRAREAEGTLIAELSCTNMEKFVIYQERDHNGPYVMYQTLLNPRELISDPIPIYQTDRPLHQPDTLPTTASCPRPCPHTPPRKRDVLYYVEEYTGLREQTRRVGLLHADWSISRQSTPPPYVTMDNRRRCTRTATINMNQLVKELSRQPSTMASLMESSSAPLPDSPPTSATMETPIQPAPTNPLDIPLNVVQLIPRVPLPTGGPSTDRHPFDINTFPPLHPPGTPNNSSSSSSAHDMDISTVFEDTSQLTVSDISSSDLTQFKADISFPGSTVMENSGDRNHSNTSPVLTPLVAECYRDYLAAVARLRESERLAQQNEPANQRQSNRPKKLAKNPKKPGDRI